MQVGIAFEMFMGSKVMAGMKGESGVFLGREKVRKNHSRVYQAMTKGQYSSKMF